LTHTVVFAGFTFFSECILSDSGVEQDCRTLSLYQSIVNKLDVIYGV